MKKIILCTILLLAVICATNVWATSPKHVQKAIETTESTNAASTDTTASSEPAYVDSVDETNSVNSDSDDVTIDGLDQLAQHIDHNKTISLVMLIPIIGTICGTLLVAIIIFLVFYFRYKNRQARYRLAEKALESGKPLPEGVFAGDAPQSAPHKPGAKVSNYNTFERDKGIRGTFLGFGLFIFLWALTGEFGVGCIGLLVMFIGIGRWYTSIEHRKDAEYFKNINEQQKTSNASQQTAENAEEAEPQASDNVKNDDTAAE